MELKINPVELSHKLRRIDPRIYEITILTVLLTYRILRLDFEVSVTQAVITMISVYYLPRLDLVVFATTLVLQYLLELMNCLCQALPMLQNYTERLNLSQKIDTKI